MLYELIVTGTKKDVQHMKIVFTLKKIKLQYVTTYIQ
jgi:hypothetical protein